MFKLFKKLETLNFEFLCDGRLSLEVIDYRNEISKCTNYLLLSPRKSISELFVPKVKFMSKFIRAALMISRDKEKQN